MACNFRGLLRRHKHFFHRQFSVSSVQQQNALVSMSTFNDHIEFETDRLANHGITDVLGTYPKVIGSIKNFCSDFQVREVDLRGNISKLTDLSPLPPPPDKLISADDIKFIYFTMFKEGLSHQEACSIINNRLKCPHHLLTSSGRKDKKAQTTQKMAIRNVPGIRELLMEMRNEMEFLKLGNFTYADRGLKLGKIKGNHFTLLLRSVRLELTDVHINSWIPAALAFNQSMDHFRKHGFINYFGLQRFGATSRDIGISLLKMDWEGVFDNIFTPFNNDCHWLRDIKKIWFTDRDTSRMLQLIPPNNFIDTDTCFAVRGLASNFKNGKGDFRAAYDCIPVAVRQFYVSSFLSYIWNEMASFRIKKFGLRPIVGDYVRCPNMFTDGNNKKPSSKKYPYYSMDPQERQQEIFAKNQVKILTEEDVHNYSIYNVVLPFLGISLAEFHHPELQDYHEKLLNDHGLDSNCYFLNHMKPDMVHGFFRYVLSIPESLNYKIVPYNRYENLTTLVPSDLDLLQLNHHSQSDQLPNLNDNNGIMNYCNQNELGNSAQDIDVVRHKICAVVEFTLKSSCYATMALREVLMY